MWIKVDEIITSKQLVLTDAYCSAFFFLFLFGKIQIWAIQKRNRNGEIVFVTIVQMQMMATSILITEICHAFCLAKTIVFVECNIVW